MGIEFNHLTISVRDLARSTSFYSEIVGLRLEATWDRGAYLTAGATWICLSVDAYTRTAALSEYTHFAFGCDATEFDARAARIRSSGAPIWKENRSEGESLYFLDPDGHKLELHVGDLRTRLQACREKPYNGMKFHAAGAPLESLADELTTAAREAEA